jgi:SAM-dependent methyltransferase
MRGVSVRLRRQFHGLRTEGAGACRETAAVALGVFIGCLPVYGFHLLICWTVGFALGLNRLKMYLAANISNPLVAPWLLFTEVQAGGWFLRGDFHPLTLEEIRTTGAVVLGIDLLIGSMLVGSTLAALAAAGTYAAVRSSGLDRHYAELVRCAADRYAGASIAAWEFARGKLSGDPVYRATLSPDVLRSGGTLLDVGCGQGLTLALLAEARRAADAGRWPPGSPSPPRFDRMAGIETRRRSAATARAALDGDAEIIEGDARTFSMERASAVLLFDVLHLMRPEEQEALLAETAAHLEPGGVVLVRETDASAGWRFTAVRLGNRMKAIAFRTRHQSFHARTAAEWRDCFSRRGFKTEVRPMGGGTPFANVLFRLTAEPRASASTHPPSPPA